MVNQQQIVQLELTLSEVNTILAAIGKLPYIEVYQLINKIQSQGGHQMEAQHNGNGTRKEKAPIKQKAKSTN